MKCMMLTMMAVATVTGAANADVTYLTQSRSVSLDSTLSQSASAPDFNLFDVMLNDPGDQIGSMLAPSFASQTSSLLSDRLHASGSLSASDGNNGTGTDAAVGFDVTFSVDQPTPYNLVGSWDSGLPNFLLPQSTRTPLFVQLTGPGINFDSHLVIDALGENNIYADAFDVSGVLQPGEYRLNIQFAWTNRGAGPGDPNTPETFDVTLLVPASSSALAFLPAVGLVARRRRR